MKIGELTPPPSDKCSFRLFSFKSVPKEAGCYILATFNNDILYIGLSKNLFDRFQQHLRDSKKINLTNDGKAIWFYFMLYDASNLPKLERTWLNQFSAHHGRHPILNKVDSPIG
ncbi:MAG: GIY-YIG nuclease family protein [Candidatus Staskawiczbacteria bacterium]|nr:GIY-YIG nuclease family protein [Candidatus Staskawiczbacteria bacterium]